jgi:hypothetical protein
MDDLLTPPESSAAEELAALVPATAPVVKAFNTTFASTLVDGESALPEERSSTGRPTAAGRAGRAVGEGDVSPGFVSEDRVDHYVHILNQHKLLVVG